MRVDYNSLIDEKYESDSSEKIWTEYYKPFYSKIGWDFWKIFDYEELEYELVNEKKSLSVLGIHREKWKVSLLINVVFPAPRNPEKISIFVMLHPSFPYKAP